MRYTIALHRDEDGISVSALFPWDNIRTTSRRLELRPNPPICS